jgi:hypothetical protein
LKEGEKSASITFSAEENTAFAEVRQNGDEEALFSGYVKEGEIVTLPAPKDGKRAFRVLLKNCGVYAIEATDAAAGGEGPFFQLS